MSLRSRFFTLMRSQWVQTTLFFGLIFGLFFTGSILLWFVTLDIPSVDSFHSRQVSESTKIYDRTGKVLLYDVHGTVRRTVVPLENISHHIRNATIAIEDDEFYQHNGIRPLRTLKAIFDNITSGNLLGGQGGSTITQQVVKNTLLTRDKTITRKIKEWILALKLEKQLTKDEILGIYLNESPYGGTIYGVEEASLHFFGKSSQDVTLVEAAYLAALPQAPTYYSPYGNHLEALENRKNLVLNQMKKNDFISEEEYTLALETNIEFIGSDDTGIKAPHFVFYVREYLEEKYGINAVNEQGLHVITTLDYALQSKGEEIVERYALENEVKYNAENAGLVAIDPRTGQILTMVGSRGYFDESIDGKFNLALAERQPGSAFKPFVYASAFEQGYTPETVVFDLKTQFSTTCAPNNLSSTPPCYSPENYDNIFRGPMTLRDALAQSVNIPAVKVLYLSGIDAALSMAERLGITTLTNKNRYGLTLVLGGGEVSLLEMVGAYGVFANEGERNETVGILRVEDAQGKVLEEYKEKKTRVLDTEVARQVSDVLSDNVARTPAFGEFSYLHFTGIDVAAKTGTTNDYRDAWIIGYTPSVSAGAWAGNNDNTPMEKRVAGFIIAPLWNEFMKEAIVKFPPKDFTPPKPLDQSITPILRGIWNSSQEGVHSILYWVDKKNPLLGKPSNPQKDSQFFLWEYPVLLWASNSGIVNTPISTTSPVDSPIITNTFSISNPSPNNVVKKDIPFTITVSIDRPERFQNVSYYINDTHIGTASQFPFSLTFIPTTLGQSTLKAVGGGVNEARISEVQFTVQ